MASTFPLQRLDIGDHSQVVHGESIEVIDFIYLAQWELEWVVLMNKPVLIGRHLLELKDIVSLEGAAVMQEEGGVIGHVDHFFHALLFQKEIVLLDTLLIQVNVTDELTILAEDHRDALDDYHDSASILDESRECYYVRLK